MRDFSRKIFVDNMARLSAHATVSAQPKKEETEEARVPDNTAPRRVKKIRYRRMRIYD